MKNTTKASERRRAVGIAGNRAICLEIGAVLFLVCAPELGHLGCLLFWGGEYQELVNEQLVGSCRTATAFDAGLFESTFFILRYIPIVLFIMWRSGHDWSRFGLVRPKYGKDVLIGLGLSLIITVIDYFVHVLSAGDYPLPDLLPVAIPWHRGVLLVAQCCAIGFSEELWARAYLIPRVEAMTGAAWKGVLLSVVVFGFVHLFKGAQGVTGALIGGTVWSIAFCLTRRIWPVALSHAISDFAIYTHLGATVGL